MTLKTVCSVLCAGTMLYSYIVIFLTSCRVVHIGTNFSVLEMDLIANEEVKKNTNCLIIFYNLKFFNIFFYFTYLLLCVPCPILSNVDYHFVTHFLFTGGRNSLSVLWVRDHS